LQMEFVIETYPVSGNDGPRTRSIKNGGGVWTRKDSKEKVRKEGITTLENENEDKETESALKFCNPGSPRTNVLNC